MPSIEFDDFRLEDLRQESLSNTARQLHMSEVYEVCWSS